MAGLQTGPLITDDDLRVDNPNSNILNKLYQNNIKQFTVTQPKVYPVASNATLDIGSNANDEMFGRLGVKLNEGTGTLKQLASPLTRIFDFAFKQETPASVLALNAECTAYNTLENNVNQYVTRYSASANANEATEKCGFVYNPTSNMFQGFPGYYDETIKSGRPYKSLNTGLFKHPDTMFYWNMNDRKAYTDPLRRNRGASYNTTEQVGDSQLPYIGAKNAFEYWKCQQKNPTCTPLAESNARLPPGTNPECVWAGSLNRAVPFRSTENYPVGESNIYINRCSPEVEEQRTVSQWASPDACKDNIINGPCIRALAQVYQCKDEGAIITAIDTATPGAPNSAANFYGISRMRAFSNYTNWLGGNNKRLAPGNMFIREDGTTVEQAAQWMSNLARDSSEAEQDRSSKGISARTLCLNKDLINSYDFCTEINDNDTDFLTSCLQKEFRVNGGQMTGLMYPKNDEERAEKWGNSNWREVKEVIDTLKNNLNSPDIDVQAHAFQNFLGIDTEKFTKQYVKRSPGCEVFWFSLTGNVGPTYGEIDAFLGRRIQLNIEPELRDINNTNVMFVTYFNLRPPTDTKIRFDLSSSGKMKVLLNRNLEQESAITVGNAIAQWNSPLRIAANPDTNCWPVSRIRPNYFTIASYSANKENIFTKTAFATCGTSGQEIPSDQFTLAQEPDAPMISFEVSPSPTTAQLSLFSFSQSRLNYFFGDSRMNGYFPVTPVGGTNIIDITEQFGYAQRYDSTAIASRAIASGGKIVTLPSKSYIYGAQPISSGSYIKTKNIATQSWRTISMLFKTGSLAEVLSNQTRYIFQYDILQIGVNNTGGILKLNISFNSLQRNLNIIEPNTEYYLLIIQDIDDASTEYKTTNMKIVCLKVNDMKAPEDTARNEIFSNRGGSRWAYNGITQSVWGTVSSNIMIIGGQISNTPQSVGMKVGWLRLFDYVFTTDDIEKDINNAWERHWFNMI